MAHSEVDGTKLVLVLARKGRGADHWDGAIAPGTSLRRDAPLFARGVQ